MLHVNKKPPITGRKLQPRGIGIVPKRIEDVQVMQRFQKILSVPEFPTSTCNATWFDFYLYHRDDPKMQPVEFKKAENKITFLQTEFTFRELFPETLIENAKNDEMANSNEIMPLLGMGLEYGRKKAGRRGKIVSYNNRGGICCYTDRNRRKWLIVSSDVVERMQNEKNNTTHLPELPEDLYGCLAVLHQQFPEKPKMNHFLALQALKHDWHKWEIIDSVYREEAKTSRCRFACKKLYGVIAEGLNLPLRDLEVTAARGFTWTQNPGDCGFCAVQYIFWCLDIDGYSAELARKLRQFSAMLVFGANIQNRFVAKLEDVKVTDEMYADPPPEIYSSLSEDQEKLYVRLKTDEPKLTMLQRFQRALGLVLVEPDPIDIREDKKPCVAKRLPPPAPVADEVSLPPKKRGKKSVLIVSDDD